MAGGAWHRARPPGLQEARIPLPGPRAVAMSGGSPRRGDEAGGPEGRPGAGLEGRGGHRRPLRVPGARELGWRAQWGFRQVARQLGQRLWFPGRGGQAPSLGVFFPGGSDGKESACDARDPSPILGQEGPLEAGMATHCGILAWRIPWMEEPGGLQSRGSQTPPQLSD